MKCPSTPLEGEYKNKTLCKETKPGYCLKLVTSTRPQVMAQRPPHFIWDNPSAGFFIVITEISKKSSGTYWCGIDRGPKESIHILKNISLVVTSSELFTERRGLPGVSGEMKPLTSFPCLTQSYHFPARSHTDYGQLGPQFSYLGHHLHPLVSCPNRYKLIWGPLGVDSQSTRWL